MFPLNRLAAAMSLSLMVFFTASLVHAESVFFSEFNYHPRDGKPEYIEILNQTTQSVDLSNWRFTDGIEFQFPPFNAGDPQRNFMCSYERILVSNVDEATLRGAYPIPPDVKVFGPWVGALSNGGETITLEDKNGVVMATISYNDSGRKWPVSADGAGHTIEIINPNRSGRDWQNYRPSGIPDGTPGSGPAGEAEQVFSVVELGTVWKYDQSGTDLGTAWREPAFDDAAWEQGPGVFGKESKVMPGPGLQTDWTTGGKVTYYLRTEFEWNFSAKEADMTVNVVLDDGAVFYLNGQEIGRHRMPAGAIDYMTRATSTPSSVEATIEQGAAIADVTHLLVQGSNVLAVEVHNASPNSSDIAFGGEATIAAVAADVSNFLTLSEVHFDAAGNVDWVELASSSNSPVPAEGLSLSASTDFVDRVDLTGDVAANGHRSWDTSLTSDENGDLTVYLLDSSGTVFDAWRFNPNRGHENYQYREGDGEWYGGDGHTRDAPNDRMPNTDIVINEIMYDAPSDSRDNEFIELYNRGPQAVDLTGWEIVDGVRFEFPAGTSIEPGGYLVIAANAAWMESAYSGLSVLGDYDGQLSDGGELLRLEDEKGNLADQVDYYPEGAWPELADGDGSSMELRHPSMDNDSPSAWADSDESTKAPWETINYTQIFERDDWRPSTTGQEIQFTLVGDAHIEVKDVEFKRNGTGANLLSEPHRDATPTSSSNYGPGWMGTGTHWQSGYGSSTLGGADVLRIISTGHGDNKENMCEIDVNGSVVFNESYTLTFEARWVTGKPRLIAQSVDHGFGTAFLITVPRNLGTPGAPNSTLLASAAPTVSGLIHSPAVPKPGESVRITARVESAAALTSVEVVHRLDSTATSQTSPWLDGPWLRTTMHDDGATGGDVIAGDGVFTATLSQYNTQANLVQFYVEATATGGRMTTQPQFGAERPAMFIVDQRTPDTSPAYKDALLRERFIMSQGDRVKMSAAGASAQFGFKFPRQSNQFWNTTMILDEEEIIYNAAMRKSGSPWTRAGDANLGKGKWKLPGDRLFRGRRRGSIDNSGFGGQGRMYDNRIARWFLYQLGSPINEAEFVHWVVNGEAAGIREDIEPVGTDFINRNWENGNEGTLLRVDDEWRWTDGADRSRDNRNADWHYKNSDNPIRYHSEYNMRSRETDYDYTHFIDFVRTVGGNSFNEEEIMRLADPDLLSMSAAVRGYSYDWDTITMNRGKNAYMYRPPGGRWMLCYWDGDLVFQNNNVGNHFLGSLPSLPNYFRKSYIERYRKYYLNELITTLCKDSPLTNAWMDSELACLAGSGAEGNANSNFSHYRTFWFPNREGPAINHNTGIGSANRNEQFEVTTGGGATSADEITLRGTAPITVYEVRVPGQPDAVSQWKSANGSDSLTQWTLDDVRLASGVNTITVEGVDHDGLVVFTETFTITKTGNAPPVMMVDGSPGSLNVSLSAELVMDASASYDPEGEGLSFSWSATPEEDLSLIAAGSIARMTFAAPGLYEVSVEGDDGTSQSGLMREVAVYGATGFSNFGIATLDPFLEAVDVNPIADYAPGATYSLEEESGKLSLLIPADQAYPLGVPEGDPLPPPVPYVELGSTWSYSDDDVDHMATFADPDFDDAAWPTGMGIFGDDTGTIPPPGLNTPLDEDIANHVTYYFRHEFEFGDDPVGSQITLNAILDDGARFSLNGQELDRVRLPAGEITHTTLASANTPSTEERTSIPVGVFEGSGILVNGTNVLAVNLHNRSASSSDIMFDAEVDIAAYPLGQGGFSLDDTIHPWVRRALPADTEWILQTDVELISPQFGQFSAGLMIEVERGGQPFRYGFGYLNGDTVGVIQVSPAGTTGTLSDLPFAASDDVTIRIRREGDSLLFDWQPGGVPGVWDNVFQFDLSAGDAPQFGGVFAATEDGGGMRVDFDYLMLIDPNITSPLVGDIVITEVMYKPLGGAQHEYIELYNAGDDAVNLNGFSFPQGSPVNEFVFGDVTMNPGDYLLVVANEAAFLTHYGAALQPLVAGAWSGSNLNNSGEEIILLDANGLVVASFIYSDDAPWPTTPDTSGNSLVLIDPAGGNASDASLWRASTAVGGSPGETDPEGGLFAAWLAARGEVDPLATKEGEAVNNLLTYAFGVDLAGGNLETALPATGVIDEGQEQHLLLQYRRRLGDPSIGYTVEISTDGEDWTEAGDQVVEFDVTPEGDGTERVSVRLAQIFDAQDEVFLRVRVTVQ